MAVRATAAALLALVALPAGAAGNPAPGVAKPRVAIAFLPGPPPKAKPPMISRLAATRRLAVGFASAILGSYSPEQTLHDMSSGSRTWTSLYDGDLPQRISLSVGGGRGSISGWSAIQARARTPPADVVPGTLGQAVRNAGGSVAYVGVAGRRNREATVAADRQGQVETAALARRATVGRAAAREWRRASLLVVRFPGGRDGKRALSELFRARGQHDLLLVVQQPTAVARRLLAVGAAGLSGGEDLRSDSTRTDGLVVATDIAPTALSRLGLPVPGQVAGEPIEARGGQSPEQLTDFKDRLAEVGPRRWAIVVAGLAGAALLAAVAIGNGGGALRRLARGGFLAALWFPSVLLVTGVIAPSRLGEIALSALAGGALAAVTARLLAWPQAIAAAAAVTVVSHIVDLALGSAWIQRSLLGPNPILGARFYGIGNELEITLGVIGLLGLGAALASAPRRLIVWGFVVGGGVLALLLSWGRLGADVGASLMLGAGTAGAAVSALDQRRGRTRLAAVLAAPPLAVALLAALDLVSGGNAHFTRSVLRAGGLKELGDVAQRRLELSYGSLGKGIVWLLVAVAVIAIAWGVRSRRRLLRPLAATPGLVAGFYGATIAVVAGALSNDSGPIIVLIGTSYLALAAGYFVSVAGGAHEPARR